MHEDRPKGIPTDYYIRDCLKGFWNFAFDRNVLLQAYHKSKKEEYESFKSVTRTCPRFGKTYAEYPVHSRVNREKHICPDCDTRETLESNGVTVEEQDKNH